MTGRLSEPGAPEIPVAELRNIAKGLSLLQAADALSIHVIREGCAACFTLVVKSKVRGGLMVPSRFLQDRDWMYAHVTAPGTRLAARHQDRGEEHG